MKKDKLQVNWKTKSIEDLENDYWEQTSFPTNLVQRCNELRKIPLNQFLTEDLRIMIGQEIGLDYLIPLAIETLNKDLFAEGDFYPGDLLQNILNIEFTFWENHKDYWAQIDNLLKDRQSEIKISNISVDKFYAFTTKGGG